MELRRTFRSIIASTFHALNTAEAQQLIEYLNLLQQRRRWSQDQMRRFVNQYVDLNAQVNKSNEEDAGTTAYSRLSALGLETLKLATAELLEDK